MVKLINNMTEIKERSINIKAKKIRKEGFIPGILYGPEIKSTPILIEKTLFKKNLKHLHQRFDFIFKGKKFTGVLQEVQKSPITLEPIHFDIYVPSLTEAMTTTIPIIFQGEEEILKKGLILNRSLDELEVEGLLGDLPEFIKIDISNLEESESIYVKDIEISSNIKILTDKETPVATVISIEKEIVEERS